MQRKVRFPPVELATPEGLLAIGGDLSPETLVEAYGQGIFPWPLSDQHPIPWFCPSPRGILEYSRLHISHSLRKLQRQKGFTVRFNHNFAQVILHCSNSTHRPGQMGTWITPQMIQAYIKFQQLGYAFSVETYAETELVGGLYGVCIGQMVAGESMFFLRPNASKVALWALMEHLQQHGIPWLDTQMITPVVAQMGGREMQRGEYLVHQKEQVHKEKIPQLFTGEFDFGPFI